MERQELIRIIQLKLKELIDNDYILLDLPYYYNVGDVLIWQSTHDILKKIKHKCLYSSSIETYIKPQIKKGIIIIIMGGGNFGDLWVEHQEFRHKVMSDFPDNPILQLPQSVYFENQSYLAEDINWFNSHKGEISICLRDKNLYDFIRANYKNVDSYLVPDMALAFNVTKYCKIKKNGEGSIFIKRTDKEQSSIDNNRIPADAIVRDWPLMEHYDKKILFVFHIMGLLHRLNLPRNENINKKIDDFFYKRIIRPYIIKTGINLLLPYKDIYSTRLHAGILAWLLHKNVYMFDNSYGKIEGVFDLWLSDQENIKMI